jgi:hypothetical protein
MVHVNLDPPLVLRLTCFKYNELRKRELKLIRIHLLSVAGTVRTGHVP